LRYEGVVVAVTSRKRCRGVRIAQVRRDATRLLRALRVDAELSVALIGDTEMRDLNAHYRHQDRPTDVLSFGAGDETLPRGAPALLGDVVISVDTAVRQAAERAVPVAEEVRLLLAHGVLHLLGYDHERSPAEARRMFAKQRRLMAILRQRARGAKARPPRRGRGRAR
jgi:probable rRNA maturation factor